MGFYFTTDVSTKQHLNLTQIAWTVIERDASCFSYNETINETGFLNRIIENFHMDADASIMQRVDAYELELDGILEDKKKFRRFEPKSLEILKKTMKDVYELKLRSKMILKKGTGKKFTLQKSVVEILENSEESKIDIYYNDSKEQSLVGKYLKALLEEYARKPQYEREKIYFKGFCQKITDAIERKKFLEVQLNDGATYYVAPYGIVQDDERLYNYLVGYSRKKGEEQALEDACFRLYRIKKIDVRESVPAARIMSESNMERIGEKINKNGVQYLIGNLEKVKVKFTDQGLSTYKKIVHLRPRLIEENSKDDNTFVFECTKWQAITYFARFGKDAYVIEPQSIRDELARFFKEASDAYFNQNEN